MSGSVSKILSDDEFISIFQTAGAKPLSQLMGVNERAVYARRRKIEEKIGEALHSPRSNAKRYPHRNDWNIPNGEVIVASDLHLWPGQESQMLRALKKFCNDIKPKGLILNGDVLDFARISRHPPMGWESVPTPQQEIEAAQDHLAELVKLTGRAQRAWNLGNHDARFEVKLATVAPEFAKVAGIHLSDHFSGFDNGWSTWINGETVVKHRFRSGVHAPWNNTINAGKTIVTGHLHSAKVTPFTDYNGTRWGVDTGCVADTDAKQFVDYTEDNPKNWISGFGVLTFKDSRLLWPELVTSFDADHVQFRGKLIRV